jgi:hypothetical protein
VQIPVGSKSISNTMQKIAGKRYSATIIVAEAGGARRLRAKQGSEGCFRQDQINPIATFRLLAPASSHATI